MKIPFIICTNAKKKARGYQHIPHPKLDLDKVKSHLEFWKMQIIDASGYSTESALKIIFK